VPRKRATSLQVAAAAGVSRTTVSLVLNDVPRSGIPEDTRERVLEEAERLNYYPNITGRRLARGRTNTLAFVVHQDPTRAAADLFLPEVLHGLNDALCPRGYHMLFRPVDPQNPEDGYAYLIYEGYVDGLVLSGPQLKEKEAVELYEQKLPVVVTGRLPGDAVPFVDADNYQGGQLATNHLIELGHRRIGMISNAPQTYVASRERFRGYQDSLLAAGLYYDPALLREGSFTSESGQLAMSELLELEDPPTAVFVASDVVAFGAMAAIKARGLSIPEDVAVVGFDDVAVARYVEPALTTIRLPAYELGCRAGEVLLRLINDDENPEPGRLLPTELVVRESCGARVRAAA
jgi:DNA-binding LacI/PurR family transcriptional regulator